jgi:hypothetical protein
MRAMDVQLTWVGHIGERYTIEPSVSFFNIFNFVNYDPTGNTLSGALSGSPGSINGTAPADRTNRIGTGSGLFALGAPRAIEWNLKFTF